MTPIKRRHFLQAAGSTLAAIGLSQFDFLRQANQYGRVLAQGTPRKLALLVGINSYASARNLQGCLTDVDLQRELLIHRFGFHPSDIVQVWDNAETSDLQPTRENILRVFKEHLIAQAKPGDVVVFHFSGHGSLVADLSEIDSPECRANQDCHLNGTIVPNDVIEPQSDGTIIVPDIMGRSLFLLTRALETEYVTLVLDSCYSGAGTRGNTLVRAAQRVSRGENAIPGEREYELQRSLLSQLGLDQATFEAERRRGIAKGIALGSARRNQEALDYRFDDFHAGAFTYLLTRYLWQLPNSEAAGTTYINLARSTKALSERRRYNQEPIIEFQPDRTHQEQPLYFVSPITPSAEAVITRFALGQVKFWMGGVSAQTIAATDTVFTVLDESGQSLTTATGDPVEIQQRQRAGLVGYGEVIQGEMGQLRQGMLLRERIVGIPANPVLKLGLDPSLGDGLEQGRSALQRALMAGTMNRIETAPVDGSTSLDYILGRMTEAYQQQLTEAGETDLPLVGTVGLFTPALSPLRSSFARIDESIVAAVNRLKPQFRLLLVGNVLEGVASTESALQIRGEIFSASGVGSVVAIASRGVTTQTTPIQTFTVDTQPFATGDAIQIKIENQEDQDLFLSCLAIDSSGNLITLYPIDFEAPEDASRIVRGGNLTVPRPEDEIDFKVSGSGYLQVLTLVSTQPLRNVLRGLQGIARRRGESRGFLRMEGDEPLDLINGLLGDLGELSRSSGVTIQSVQRNHQVPTDTNVLAAFSTLIEIRE